MITKLFKLWNDEGSVYLLGMANAGKSVLYNQLLESDYCRTLASEAIAKATTSFWPGTTLNMLKFPITFLDKYKYRLRAKRVLNDKVELEKIEMERYNLYKKTYNLKHAELIGIIGNSFKQNFVANDAIDARIDSTYSMDELTGEIKEGENFNNISDFMKNRVKDAREDYKHEIYENKAAWFYDTPGVLGTREILKLFSKQELQIVFPLGVIMPRVYWMKPGQSLFVGGLMRIDLLEVNKIILL
jgi:nitric oxide-associated protein 1